jgi:hypothetical protein
MVWRLSFLSSLVLGALGWGLLTLWVLKADPWHRLVLASQLGRASGQAGKVVLVGDSIVKPLGSPCPSYINLAVRGARARDVPDNLIGEVAYLAPRVILVMIGINDLRWGDSAEAAARSIVSLARRLQTAAPLARVVVLAPLPMTPGEIAGVADKKAVRNTAMHLREMLQEGEPRFADASALFGVESLIPTLTGDGLHLNATGTARLWGLVQGLAIAAGAEACR